MDPFFSSAQRGGKQGGTERSLLDNWQVLPGDAEIYDQGSKQKNSRSSQKVGVSKINNYRRCWEKSKYIDWSNFILLGRIILAWDFPGGPGVKNPPYNAGDSGLIPGQGTKIPHAVGQLSPCATTTELVCLN